MNKLLKRTQRNATVTALRGRFTVRKGRRAALKTGREGTEAMWWGRMFQVPAAATGNARSPTVERRVQRRISDDDEADHRR